MAATEDDLWWIVARRRSLRAALRKLEPLPNGTRLLEAGCGLGGNLAMLEGFGRASAFESDAGARELARRKSAVHVSEGRLPADVPFEAESFDLVVALDVLEHIDDDLSGLRTLRDRLRPGGWMVITVPAFSFLWSHHDIVHHHKRRYRKQELIRLASETGRSPATATYFNTLPFPVIVMVRLFENLLLIRGVDDAVTPPTVVNRILMAIFASKCRLIRHMALPIWISLVLVARKPG
jgi:SAM-dependent methyltransferase